MQDLGPLRALAFSGGEWVIYLLIACSILTLAVVIDRWWAKRREEKCLAQLEEKARGLLESGEFEQAEKVVQSIPGAASAVLLAGLRHRNSGAAAVEEHLAAARVQEKKRLELRLLILGTLGNNAPFIGLFGTVLGVIKAFHDLSEVAAGPEVVMKGLSEALVATAIGLLVAIPAVMFFNYFQKRVNDLLADTDALTRYILAALKDESRPSLPRR